MVDFDPKAHFDWILRQADARKEELKNQIVDLQRQLREMETTISGILRIAPPHVVNGWVSGHHPAPSQIHVIPSQRYVNISTRWALLIALSEASFPMSIASLADELTAGGFRTEAANFNNNISAVLSRMKSSRSEVDVSDGKWFITDVGRSAITYIKAQRLRRGAKTSSVMTETPGA
jgi:hypothetical protein